MKMIVLCPILSNSIIPVANNDIEAANLLAAYFETCYSSTQSHLVSSLTVSNSVNLDISRFLITEESIYKKLVNLDTKISTGPDNIPSLLFERCPNYFIKPFATLFVVVHCSAVFQKLMKVSP